jgi:hypothetical protein
MRIRKIAMAGSPTRLCMILLTKFTLCTAQNGETTSRMRAAMRAIRTLRVLQKIRVGDPVELQNGRPKLFGV